MSRIRLYEFPYMSPFADLVLKDSLVYLKIRFCLALQYIQEEDGCQKVKLN